VSMGYQVGVTPLQMAAAVSSVANGGTLYEPRVVRAVVQGGQRAEVPPRVVRRTISPETAATLTGIMEQVVERGTATAAKLRGYSIAGKTGTAAKLVAGHYSKTDYNASFVGFIPSRKPALTIIVVVDTPRAGGYYGGSIAAPIFKRIAEASLRYLGLPPTIDPATPVLIARQSAADQAPQRYTHAVASESVAPPTAPGSMPDVRGLSAREAVRRLAHLGIMASLEGDGVVVGQEPSAGSHIDGVTSCRLVLDRQMPATAPGGDRP
jgi:cell division protein FtsI (penicillin-binding protein 3)